MLPVGKLPRSRGGGRHREHPGGRVIPSLVMKRSSVGYWLVGTRRIPSCRRFTLVGSSSDLLTGPNARWLAAQQNSTRA